jgi:hypothetical protein
MKYMISTDGMPYETITPEAALCKAALLIYFPQGRISEFRDVLNRGEELNIVYGFKSVTITPVA